MRIDTKKGRDALASRREPYWRKLSKGRHLGFRKLADGAGSWIAKYRGEDGERAYKALGEFSEALDFDQAKVAAEAWFADLDRGVTGRTHDGKEVTVADAARNYIEQLTRDGRTSTAHDADMRFRRTIYGDEKRKRAALPLARVQLAKLRTKHLEEWRDSLRLKRGTSERNRIALIAALNRAVTDRLVTADRAIEWKAFKPLKGGAQRRDLYLDLAQRRALLAAANGALRDFIEAVALTGCRAGELTGALRSQFDARTRTLHVTGKTGSRAIPLSPPALALFARLAKSKLPPANLLARDDGKPWAHSDWDELVREAAKAAELPEGTCLYTLRHSFITQTLLDGMATLEVARLVGTSLPMIEKHYGHLAVGTAREKLAKVTLL